MSVDLSKTGILKASGDVLPSNLLLDSYGTIVDKRNNTLDSRTEYYAWNVGQSYADITQTTNVIVSFDLEMLVRDVSGYNGALIVYNSNNKGLVQINYVNYYFKDEYAVGDYINKRVVLNTSLIPRENPTLQNNYIEFYTGYGTNNFYKISNMKIQTDTGSTIWTPNESNEIAQGFIECSGTAKIYKGHVEAHEFYEY